MCVFMCGGGRGVSVFVVPKKRGALEATITKLD